MNHTSIINEPRGRMIGRIIEHWLDGQVGQQRAYADAVRMHYESQVDPGDRSIEFHHHQDADAMLKANAQLVMRFIRGAVRIPSDLEESLIHPLPDEMNSDMKRRLVGRYDLLPVRIPAATGAGPADLSALLKEASEMVSALGRLLEGDNTIDHNDSHQDLVAGLNETDDLLGVATQIRIVISEAIERKRRV